MNSLSLPVILMTKNDPHNVGHDVDFPQTANWRARPDQSEDDDDLNSSDAELAGEMIGFPVEELDEERASD